MREIGLDYLLQEVYIKLHHYHSAIGGTIEKEYQIYLDAGVPTSIIYSKGEVGYSVNFDLSRLGKHVSHGHGCIVSCTGSGAISVRRREHLTPCIHCQYKIVLY